MTQLATAFLAGVLFAFGLGVGGMTQPARVIGFLDFAGRWDPSLAFVMSGAVVTYAVLFRLVRRRKRPMLAAAFSIPTRRDVDGRLLAGAALFGVGWGLAGYCPGPGIVSLAAGTAPVVVFVTAMVAGMAIADAVVSWRPAAAGRPLTTRIAKKGTT
jgi:uncharacterized protein